LNPPSPEGCGGPDCAVFFKAFSGNATPDGPANVNIHQDNPATPGNVYVMSGWAGAEANFLGVAQFDLQFLNGANAVIGGSTLNLNTAGLFVPNGQPFNYKPYSLTATAPAGSVNVRVMASLLNGLSNPAGGGQAYVVDDFSLDTFVPEPASASLCMFGLLGLFGLIRRR
jgi:hypothetical protein